MIVHAVCQAKLISNYLARYFKLASAPMRATQASDVEVTANLDLQLQTRATVKQTPKPTAISYSKTASTEVIIRLLLCQCQPVK